MTREEEKIGFELNDWVSNLKLNDFQKEKTYDQSYEYYETRISQDGNQSEIIWNGIATPTYDPTFGVDGEKSGEFFFKELNQRLKDWDDILVLKKYLDKNELREVLSYDNHMYILTDDFYNRAKERADTAKKTRQILSTVNQLISNINELKKRELWSDEARSVFRALLKTNNLD